MVWWFGVLVGLSAGVWRVGRLVGLTVCGLRVGGSEGWWV